MVVIGICGGTGSGKSTIIQLLRQRLGPDAFTVLAHDMYYRNPEDLPPQLSKLGNVDHPRALDNRLFISHVRSLRDGKAIDQPVYRFDAHRRAAKPLRVEPRPVIILDGILLFALPRLLPLMDLKVFVDVSDDVRIVRRMVRDLGTERFRPVEETAQYYLTVIRPMHERFVAPFKRLANLVIPWENYSEAAIDVLAARIEQVRRATGQPPRARRRA